MPYTRTGPFTQAAPPAISPAFLNKVEDALTTSVYTAPAPSGGDDTAVLQPLWAAAQTTGGTLILQAGTYKANLSTSASYYAQPRLIGQGRLLTILQGTTTTAPVVRFKGISGAISGGYLADLTLTNSGGVGLEIADACGVHFDRLRLAGNLAEGIRFHSESSGGYSEYNSGMADIEPTVTLPIRYMVTNGTGSNHGSGLTVGSVINQASTATGPMIQIDAGAFPYAAPMSVALFPRFTGGAIINNLSTNAASFIGNLDIEVQVPGPMYVASPTGGRVYYEGTLGGLAASQLRLGQFYLADKVYYIQGTTYAQLRPYQRSTTLGPGTTGLTTNDATPQNGAAFLINVNISASGYYYMGQLMCWQSPTSPNGNVSFVGTPSLVSNTSGAGAPTFSWANYGLNVTNANYTNAYTATVGVVPIGGNSGTDIMGQF